MPSSNHKTLAISSSSYLGGKSLDIIKITRLLKNKQIMLLRLFLQCNLFLRCPIISNIIWDDICDLINCRILIRENCHTFTLNYGIQDQLILK